MNFRIIVLAKQVPDTRNVSKEAMKSDGTVNRSALPAIYNPEDLKALEQAIRIKETLIKNCKQIDKVEVIVLTMGPIRATEIIRESLFRGADKGYLITDRKFAGSDTLATSYVLSYAIKKLAPYHIIISGRQAIDGDTAQVGPQTAEKLNIPQITYAENIVDVNAQEIKVKRRLERGIEVVSSPFPVLITVHNSAPACRVRNAKLVMKYKHARSISELQEETKDYTELFSNRPYLNLEEWGFEDINADLQMLGLSGSPTKVKKIENVVLQQKDSRVLSGNEEDVNILMKELIANHIIG
jgi:electron transfer flavoprotein beta subunit